MSLDRDLNSWREMTLGDFVRLQRGHDLTDADCRPGPVPVMGSAGQKGFHDTAKAKGPGVVIGRSGVGSMGVVSYCQDDYWPHNTVLYVTDFLGNDQRFVYYFLQHLNLRRFDSGSAQASLNRNYVYPIRVRVPDVREQLRIAGILGLLDDKIELNRRMNRTLESIARAIFKSWFVDFDPVRKKMEGGKVGLPSDLACFFPAEFRESRMGLIPNGWECSSLGDVAQFTKGRSYKSVELGPSQTALVTLKSFSRNGGYREDGLKDYVGPYRPAQVVDAGDVLVAHTDVTQAAEVLGRAVRVRSSERHRTLVASLDTVVVRPVGDHPTREFLFLALDNSRFRDYAHGYSNGTTVLHLGAEALPEFPLVMPPANLVAAFSGIAKPLLARADLLGEENASLAAVRDGLLPELMAGRLSSGQTAGVRGRTEA